MTCCCWCFLFQFGVVSWSLKGRRCWHPGHADAIRPYGTRRALSPVMQLCQVYYGTVKKKKPKPKWTGCVFFPTASSTESQKIKQQENKYEREKTKQDRLYKEESVSRGIQTRRQASSQRIFFFYFLHFHFTPVTHTTTSVDPRFYVDAIPFIVPSFIVLTRTIFTPAV